jgi:hypothetical protein
MGKNLGDLMNNFFENLGAQRFRNTQTEKIYTGFKVKFMPGGEAYVIAIRNPHGQSFLYLNDLKDIEAID